MASFPEIVSDLILEVDYTHYLNVPRYFSLQGINFFLLLGGRGIGKTTGIVNYSVTECVKDKECQFVYIRRYKNETASAKDLLEPLLRNSACKGTSVKGVYKYEYAKRVLGYTIPLSVQQSVKSGFDFHRVKYIIFDEAFITRGGNLHYLNDEVTHFFELISTIVRTRTDYKVFILGNSLDMFNPYTTFFKIPQFEKSYIDRERGLYIEKCPNKKALLELEATTPLFKLTKDTAYGKYHYENQFLMAKNFSIREKPYRARLWYRLGYDKHTLSFWLWSTDRKTYRCWVESFEGLFDDDARIQLVVDGEINKAYVKDFKSTWHWPTFLEMYYNGFVSFNSQHTANILYSLMDMIK